MFFQYKLKCMILGVIQTFYVKRQFAKNSLIYRPILLLLNFILRILSFMCYFEQKYIFNDN